jgi:ribosomal protein L1
VVVGKVSFDAAKLVDNIEAVLSAINENKPT